MFSEITGSAIILNSKTIRIARWLTFVDTFSNQEYFWNEAFHYSMWKNQLFPSGQPNAQYSTAEIWDAFVVLQRENTVIQCSVCYQEISLKNSRICRLCGNIVHLICLGMNDTTCRYCSPKNVTISDPRNMRECEDSYSSMFRRVKKLVHDSTLSMSTLISLFHEKNGRQKIKAMVTEHFQKGFRNYLVKAIRSKGDSLGVLAATTIAPFTRVGVYPGYADLLSAKQCQYGRPIPKFQLEGTNCADYLNNIFEEFVDTCAPYINEPNVSERANCGWIQEHTDLKSCSGYSIMTIREICEGEELLIGYGPSFLRDYDFNYDHFVFLPSERPLKDEIYDLLHWPCSDPGNVNFMCSVKYLSSSDSYELYSIS